MGIFDFDKIKEKATDLAQSGATGAKQLAEISKLKMNNLSEEDAIKKAYIEIGKLYYAENVATAGGAYLAACEKITAAKAAIETNNDRIAELKDNGAVVKEEAAEATSDFVEEVVDAVEAVAETAADAVEEAVEKAADAVQEFRND